MKKEQPTDYSEKQYVEEVLNIPYTKEALQKLCDVVNFINETNQYNEEALDTSEGNY